MKNQPLVLTLARTIPKMTKKTLATGICLAFSVLLQGCGGDNNNANEAANNAVNNNPGEQKGVFLDSAVANLSFESQSNSGLTDNKGEFDFISGETFKFYIGEGVDKLLLGSRVVNNSASGRAVVSPTNLTPEGSTTHEDFVTNLAVLLQTLDNDANPDNGIELDGTTRQEIAALIKGGKTLRLNASSSDFIADMQASGLLTHRSLVSELNALKHLSKSFRQSASSTIAITTDNRKVVVVNRQKSTVSIIEVKDAAGNDKREKLAEIPVGKVPWFVTITPNNKYAYVSNGEDSTVSVIDIEAKAVTGEPIPVGTEPRGVATTGNGKYIVVANHNSKSVSIISTSSNKVINTIETGGNPIAVVVTNNGDDNDLDERVYVTRFFSELIPGKTQGFNDSRQGVIDYFYLKDAVNKAASDVKVGQYTISPMDSGFTADRRAFCNKTRQALIDNGTEFFNPNLANETFCPDTASSDISDDGSIAKTPQQVHPNQLRGMIMIANTLYVANTGASPEPPIKFNTNIQALASAVDVITGSDENSVNLNVEVKQERVKNAATASTTPARGSSDQLDGLFLGDMVAMSNYLDEVVLVSQSGNYVVSAIVDKDKITMAHDHRQQSGQSGQSGSGSGDIVRIQTGNMPSGVIVSHDGTRAYTNNEIDTSVTPIDLQSYVALGDDIESSSSPAPGTQGHRNLVGKLAFFTGLGVNDTHDINGDGAFDIPIRDIDPVQYKGKASDNNWSSCASCHDDGHADNVTWIFPTGPRQTIPLEGSFGKDSDGNKTLNDQRIFNWNGVRGSVTDFNNNSRGIQGGKGHATEVLVNGVPTDRTAEVFNHGPVAGISDALDAMTEWTAFKVRALNMSKANDPAKLNRGRNTFEAACASCHGGDKWTKSQSKEDIYEDNPTFAENPLGANFPVAAIDLNLTTGGPQIISVAGLNNTLLRFIDNVGTFDPTNPTAIRGAGKIKGLPTAGLGELTAKGGYNAPSVLGVGYSAPYFHDGSAATLDDVMKRHTLDNNGTAQTIARTIDSLFSPDQVAELILFLEYIDERTQPFLSDSDVFLGKTSP